MQSAGYKQQQAQCNLYQRQIVARGLVAPSAHDTFGEVQPDHQADPAVGVHAVFEQACQRNAQRQCFKYQP